MDLFANALLIFMTIAMLSFSSISDSRERTLPRAELAAVERQALGTSAVTPVAITAQHADGGRVRYFVRQEEIARGDLPARVGALGAAAVVLRIDKRLPFEVAADLMGALQRLGIRHVSWAVLEQ
ncbi:MAG: hypothetical protein HY727_21625 [Candidatus Rokubacteria bacterium]|nr:hypothetical protein [Candidatus Rokubacteria bacterium]